MHIRIKGYTFQLSEPFTQGTVLTRAEAQALNDLRAENIQNNLRKLVTEATAGLQPGELLEQRTIDEIQTVFTRYDLSYSFVEKHISRSRRGDIESAAREIAEEQVASRLRQLELTADATNPDWEQFVAAAETLPAVLEAARARVSARRRVSQMGLEDL